MLELFDHWAHEAPPLHELAATWLGFKPAEREGEGIALGALPSFDDLAGAMKRGKVISTVRNETPGVIR